MAIINRPYQDKVYRALNIYRDTMRAFIMRQFQENGISAESAISASLREEAQKRFHKTRDERDDIETAFDITWFRSIIERSWNEAFASAFADNKILNELDAISEVRNLVAHPPKRDINPKRATAALDRIVYVLRYVGDGKEAAEVETIMVGKPDLQTIPSVQVTGVSPEEVQQIAETVAQRVEQGAPRVQATEDLTEKLGQVFRQLLSNELAPVMDTLTSAQGQLAEEVAGRVETIINALKPDVRQQETPQSTEEIMGAVAELLEGFRALEARVTDAYITPVTVPPQPARQDSSTPISPLEGAPPSSIADKWLGVLDELRTVKVNEFNLGSLLKDCRPIDVWIQRDPEKLILPFRHPFHLNSMQEVSEDPRGREAVEKAITNHFGRALEFECVLDSPLPF